MNLTVRYDYPRPRLYVSSLDFSSRGFEVTESEKLAEVRIDNMGDKSDHNVKVPL